MARTDVAACRARQEEAALYFLQIKKQFKKKRGRRTWPCLVEGIATTWPSYQGPRLADEEDKRMGLYSSPKTRKEMKTHILKELGQLVAYTGRATI
jgi:hypothetical protein